MKKRTAIGLGILFLAGCGKAAIEKPDNLIDENKMADIIYDFSVLEGVQTGNYKSLEKRHINPSTYVYSKYKIDSLQFVKSDRYYASDIEVYAKIYDKVAKRIEKDKALADSLSKTEPKAKEKPKKPAMTKDSALAKKREILKKINSGSGNNPK